MFRKARFDSKSVRFDELGRLAGIPVSIGGGVRYYLASGKKPPSVHGGKSFRQLSPR